MALVQLDCCKDVTEKMAGFCYVTAGSGSSSGVVYTCCDKLMS